MRYKGEGRRRLRSTRRRFLPPTAPAATPNGGRSPSPPVAPPVSTQPRRLPPSAPSSGRSRCAKSCFPPPPPPPPPGTAAQNIGCRGRGMVYRKGGAAPLPHPSGNLFPSPPLNLARGRLLARRGGRGGGGRGLREHDAPMRAGSPPRGRPRSAQ